MVFIAAQKIDGISKGKKYVEKRNYTFPLLFDEKRKVTHAYGVYHPIGSYAFNIARPATFIVGPSGRICWIAVSPSQRERPSVEQIFAAIEACDKY